MPQEIQTSNLMQKKKADEKWHKDIQLKDSWEDTNLLSPVPSKIFTCSK